MSRDNNLMPQDCTCKVNHVEEFTGRTEVEWTLNPDCLYHQLNPPFASNVIRETITI